jgi:hypothetical protein
MLEMATHMLDLFLETQTIQSEYKCETTFGTIYIGYHIFSLDRKSAVYMLTVKLSLLNGSHMAVNYAFDCVEPE